MQIKEGGAVPVEEIVAVTMGPESAVRALHKAVSLGADRSVHLTDDAARGLRRRRHRLRAGEGARARVARPGAARPAVRRRRVLHDRRRRGRPPADALADAGDQDGRRRRRAALRASGRVRLRHRRRSSCPAVISVGDAINEPRYPSLKAIMGAKKKPLDTKATGDVGIDGAQGRRGRLARRTAASSRTRRPRPPARSSRTRTRTRRSRRSSPGSTRGS